MAETLTITSDEVEAVAGRIDADEPLDARDKAILRGVFVLAGRAAATAEQDETLIAAALADPASSGEGSDGGDEVGGYAFDFGPTTPGVSLELGFTGPVTDAAKGSFSASHRLMQACCKGKHIPEATIE